MSVRLAQPLIALCLFAALPGLAAAAVCDGSERVEFGRHRMPLDAVIEPTEVTAPEPFLDLPNFSSPILLTHAGDASNRLFVAEQYQGKVRYFYNDPAADEAPTYLDIDDPQNPMPTGPIDTAGEMGLLGLAFAPDFATSGELYIYYSANRSSCQCSSCNHCSKIVRLTADPPTADSVDVDTAELLLEVDQPNGNHNGGMIAFGPADGYLYISLGDGGGSDDTGCNSQDLDDPLGSILRIDVSTESGYAIPPDNPEPLGFFEGLPEIYHYGLRNPWRFSFDRLPPYDMWIGDVGQREWEEIDYVPGDAGGGFNFGWNDREGKHDFDDVDCSNATAGTDPVLEYPNPNPGSAAVSGGYVYRGTSAPSLYGAYIFADYASGQVWAWDRTTKDPQTGLGITQLLVDLSAVSAFGEDEEGELYIVNYGGQIRRLEPVTSEVVSFPTLLSQTGFFDDTENLVPAVGMIDFEVESELWSDDAEKIRWLALPTGERIGFQSTGAWDFPVGTALVKHFELPAPGGLMRRLETRVLLRQPGDWVGVTYRWNESQTDAELLTRGLAEVVDVEFDGIPGTQTWNYPSPGMCLGCHTTAGGKVLGPRTRQLNHAGSFGENQLERLDCDELFDTSIGPASQFDGFSALTDGGASVQHRARSYLASNCSFCHSPGGPAPGGLDVRYDTLLDDMNLIGISPTSGDLGITDPERIKPGVKEESILWHRVQSEDSDIRMAQTTLVPHDEAIALLGEWIELDLFTLDSDEDSEADATDNCPAVDNPGQEDADIDGLGDLCDPDAAPDLSATSDNPANLSLASRAILEGSVTNSGPGYAIASQVTFYLSDDQIFDADEDALVGDCFASEMNGPGQIGCQDPEAWIPYDLAEVGQGESASLYWVTCADSLGLVFESDETNNCSVDPSPVLVPEPASAALRLAALFVLGVLARRQTPG